MSARTSRPRADFRVLSLAGRHHVERKDTVPDSLVRLGWFRIQSYTSRQLAEFDCFLFSRRFLVENAGWDVHVLPSSATGQAASAGIKLDAAGEPETLGQNWTAEDLGYLIRDVCFDTGAKPGAHPANWREAAERLADAVGVALVDRAGPRLIDCIYAQVDALGGSDAEPGWAREHQAAMRLIKKAGGYEDAPAPVASQNRSEAA